MPMKKLTLQPGEVYHASHEDFIGQESFMATTKKIERLHLHESGVVKVKLPHDLRQKSGILATNALKKIRINEEQRQQLVQIQPHLYSMDRTPSKQNPVVKRINMSWQSWRKKYPTAYEEITDFWKDFPTTIENKLVTPYAPGILGSLMDNKGKSL